MTVLGVAQTRLPAAPDPQASCDAESHGLPGWRIMPGRTSDR